MKKFLLTCDRCGHSWDLYPDSDEHSFFRIAFQEINVGCDIDSDDPYESITMDICPDCLIAAGKFLNQEKELNKFLNYCKEQT